jgi:hypothetical protein
MNEYTGTSLMMIGAIAALSFVIGSFFMRFWRVTGDRFFLLFGLSFWLEGTNRVLVGAMPAWREEPTPLSCTPSLTRTASAIEANTHRRAETKAGLNEGRLSMSDRHHHPPPST